jgi:NitT/TauT family transport system ATP-binding protein
VDVFAEGVRKVWGDTPATSVVALEATTHHFASGRFSCLLGPSGCGKSTLLQVIAGLERPSSGTVRVSGGDAKPSDKPGMHSVMMWQSLNLFPWRTVIDNVAFGLEMGGVSKPARYERARTLLASVGLSGFEVHLPKHLSGGMRQRVALARALIMQRPILLMDEPFGALDAQTKIVMQEELIRIFEADPMTVIFVTHAIDEAILLGDEVVVMTARPGRIKEVIPIDLPRPRHIDQVNTPRFGELFDRVFHLIREEVTAAMLQQQRSAV